MQNTSEPDANASIARGDHGEKRARVVPAGLGLVATIGAGVMLWALLLIQLAEAFK